MNPRVFLDFTVDEAPVGRVIFELFKDAVPRTVENFRALCTGEKGISPFSQRPLYYKNSIIHRSIAGFMIQGGDFTKMNGTGGESIYGTTPFEDEDLTRPMDTEGLLCMANKGPNTNGSQFFITLAPCPHLKGKHVVFGRVIRGFDVVQKISELAVDEKSRPVSPVVINNCGELELRHKSTASMPREDKKSRKKYSSRSHSRSSSHSEPRSGSRERRKRKHRKRDTSGDHTVARQPELEDNQRKETEEEYDARLEREERERMAARKREELELRRSRYQQAPTNDGVRFKGRGRMRYVDPEVRRSHGWDD
jgi:peptidyl-prolyl isomerase G (cyclophilin G)